jgi:hypothetical protein
MLQWRAEQAAETAATLAILARSTLARQRLSICLLSH